MWSGKSISVVLPTYNERGSIRQCVLKFFKTGVVDEIIVVNNNAIAGTSEEIRGTGAKEVFEERQGYGAAIRRGLVEATGDYIIVCEPDGTFIEEDIFKLLSYGTDHDIVFGSRTVREFIWGGANMGQFLRWGNYVVAKLIELLFNTNSLSDVGCTFRLISRSALETMQHYFRVFDNYFGPEMILLATRLNIRFVQIPVNYKSRVGQSSVTGNPVKAFRLGLQMIIMILIHRMEGALIPTMHHKDETISGVFNTYRYYLFYIALFILCAFWIRKPLTEYLVGDSSKFVLLVYSVLGVSNTHLIDLSSGRDIWHPFLYQSILIATARLFGMELYKLRLIGLACLMIDLYMIRKIANLMVDNQREGRVLTFLACLFFLMIPLTIDGAMHIDIDTTVMLPLLLVFLYLFIRQEQAESMRDRYLIMVILMCFIMPLLLWSKLTTPLALPLAIGTFYVIRKRPLTAIIYPTLLLAIGGGIFLLTWYLFCYHFNLAFLSVFERMIRVFSIVSNESANAGYLKVFREFAMIVFWFNIIMSLLLIVCLCVVIRRVIRRETIRDPILFASILSFIIGGVYCLIGGISYGIPKYHYPLTALAALIVSYHLRPYCDRLSIKIPLSVLFAIIVVSVFYYYIEDPIYLLTRGIKLRAIDSTSFNPILNQLWIISFIYLLPFFISMVLWARSKRQYAVELILVVAMAQMVGFNFHKSQAAYHTSHGYGYYGASDVYRQLIPLNSVWFTEGVIISPFDILPPYALDETPMNYDEYRLRIVEKSPDAIVFGAPCSTVSQMKQFFLTPEFNRISREHYKLDTVGDYYIYVKT